MTTAASRAVYRQPPASPPARQPAMEETAETAASQVAGAAIQLHNMCVQKQQHRGLVDYTHRLRNISHHASVAAKKIQRYPSVGAVSSGGMPHGTDGAAYDDQICQRVPGGALMYHVPVHRISSIFAPNGTSICSHSILGMASGPEIMQPLYFAPPTVVHLPVGDGQPGTIPYRRWGRPYIPVCNIQQLAEFELADTERAISQRSAATRETNASHA